MITPSDISFRPNAILCGDSAKILGRFPDACIDLVVTDPPYLVRYRDRFGRTLANDDNPGAVFSIYGEMYRLLKPNSYCVTFCGWTEIAAFSAAWSEAGFATVGHIVWRKPYASRTSHTEYRHESAYLLAKGRPAKPQRPIPDIHRSTRATAYTRPRRPSASSRRWCAHSRNPATWCSTRSLAPARRRSQLH